MSFLSRTLITAYANFAELIAALENTKPMWTQRQRQMAQDAIKAAGERFRDNVAAHGYDHDAVGEPIKRQFQIVLERRQKACSVTVSRREARVAKEQARFVER